MLLDRLSAHTGGLTLTVTAPGGDLSGSYGSLSTTLRHVLADARVELEARDDLGREERELLLAWWPPAVEIAVATPPRHGVWLAVSAEQGQTLVPLAPEVAVEPAAALEDRVALLRPLVEHEQQPRELLVLTLAEEASDLRVLDVAARTLTSAGAPFPLVHDVRGGPRARDAGSSLRDEQRRHHWRRVAHATHDAAVTRDLPVVTVGVGRDQSLIREVSRWPDELAVPLLTSPEQHAEQELIEGVLAAAEAHQQAEVRDAERLLDDRAGQGRTMTGLTDVHRAAVGGRVELLFVEPGPSAPGFLTDTGELVAEDPGGATEVPDAEARCMAEVVRRGGRVRLATGNGSRKTVATLRW